MKFLICLFILCFSVLPTNAVTLKGGIAYTVEQARTEAFDGIEYSLPAKIIKKNKTDPNYDINKMLIENDVDEVADRFIQLFNDGYCIVYKQNLNYGYYYKFNGELEHIEKISNASYPYKGAKYNLNGKLIRVVISPQKDNSYIFFPDGTLDTHWVGNKEYDKNGKIINQRY